MVMGFLFLCLLLLSGVAPANQTKERSVHELFTRHSEKIPENSRKILPVLILNFGYSFSFQYWYW